MQNYQQPPQYFRMLAPNLKGRPVSSLEEVRASAVDFDGSIFYFPSLAEDKIYTKQINLDGTSTVKVYELADLPNVQPGAQYITKEEFDKKINEIMQKLSSKASTSETKPNEVFNF